MQKTCTECSQNFLIREADLSFFEKVSPTFAGQKYVIPAPHLCPDCRQKRRLRFRNERNLYARNCDYCHKEIISVYPAGTAYPVYCPECWWSDKWDALSFGQSIDGKKDPLEHVKELLQQVPVISLINVNNENSTYAHDSENNKNCYLIFSTFQSEDTLYTTASSKMRNCMDCYWSADCELCYDIVSSVNCYQSMFSTHCGELNFSYFCHACENCSNCFACFGLRNKEYHIFNQPYSKEEYTKKVNEFKEKIKTWGELEQMKKAIQTFWQKQPHKYATVSACENSTGDYLANCKNCAQCFNTVHAEDSAYLFDTIHIKDLQDCDLCANAELMFNCQSCTGTMNICSSFCTRCHNIYYCNQCFSCNNCFGCVGLNHKEYCIFNKQYSKEEYEKLLPQLIAQMKDSWGAFFPADMAQISEQDSVVSYYFPEKDAKSIDELLATAPIYPHITPPKARCATCNKDYAIIKQEVEFYQRQGLPIPPICSVCRQKRRIQQQPAHKLYERNCMKCQQEIISPYAPTNPLMIYCEKCYLEFKV